MEAVCGWVWIFSGIAQYIGASPLTFEALPILDEILPDTQTTRTLTVYDVCRLQAVNWTYTEMFY